MHDVLRPGGRLVLHSRNWEKLHARPHRFTHFNMRQRDGLQCIPLYVWSVPREWGPRLTIELVLIFSRDGQVHLRTHEIVDYPFTHESLLGRLEQCGFVNVRTDFDEASDEYAIVATR